MGKGLPPIVYFFACLALGALLHYYRPLAIADYSFLAGMVTGLMALLLATSLAAWGIREMRRLGTPIEPGLIPVRLVTSGPFRFTRNPLYVAQLLVLAGLATMVNSAWLAFGTGVLLLLLDRLVVAREEAVNTRTFGTQFTAYASRVRRWL